MVWSFPCVNMSFFLTAAVTIASIHRTVGSLSPEHDPKVFSLPLVPHHVQKQRRRMEHVEDDETYRRRDAAQQVGALYQGYGTHYVDLWVGTPPQRQTVIVDTGSGVTAFPCSGCTDCGDSYHIDKYFIEADSSSFHKFSCNECARGRCQNKNANGDGECRIGMSYQEGSSWSAYECKDRTYAGGPHSLPLLSDNGGNSDLDPYHASAFSFDLTFGCQTHITGLFKTQLADGIMGMDNAATAFWNQMKKAGAINSNVFALCFSRQPTADREGTEAGALTLGGVDDRFHTSPMVYTGGGGAGGFFNVHIRRIYLREGNSGDSAMSSNPNAQVVPIDISEDLLNRGRVIVDSGTTDSYFTRQLNSPFLAAYKKMTGKDYNHNPVSLTKEQIDAMPTILVQLAGDVAQNQGLFKNDAASTTGLAATVDPKNPYDVLLAIPASHYMEYDEKKGKYVGRFYTDEGSGSVIGANAMMGHNIVFDVDQGRVGWAESECDYTFLINASGFGDNGSTSSEKTTTPTEDEGHKPDDHSLDKPTAKPASDSSSASNGGSIQPVLDACSDWTCRGAVLGSLLGVLIVGIFVGRMVSSRRRGSEVAYQTTEMVAVSSADDEEFTPRYRDDPDDEVVAAEGTGYDSEEDAHVADLA